MFRLIKTSQKMLREFHDISATAWKACANVQSGTIYQDHRTTREPAICNPLII